MAAYPGCVALRDELYDAASSRAKAGHYKDRKGDNPSLMKLAAAKSISLSPPPPSLATKVQGFTKSRRNRFHLLTVT